jgi:hypothetical protein
MLKMKNPAQGRVRCVNAGNIYCVAAGQLQQEPAAGQEGGALESELGALSPCVLLPQAVPL